MVKPTKFIIKETQGMSFWSIEGSVLWSREIKGLLLKMEEERIKNPLGIEVVYE